MKFAALSPDDKKQDLWYTFIVRGLPDMADEYSRDFSALNKKEAGVAERQELRQATFWGAIPQNQKKKKKNAVFIKQQLLEHNRYLHALNTEE